MEDTYQVSKEEFNRQRIQLHTLTKRRDINSALAFYIEKIERSLALMAGQESAFDLEMRLENADNAK
jgi:hypothetical protein